MEKELIQNLFFCTRNVCIFESVKNNFMKNLILLTMVSFMFACNSTDCTNGIQDGNETGIDCGGSECATCSIDYPTNGIHGQNILFGDADLTLSGSGEYSFKAEVPVGSTLKIILTSNGGAWGLSNKVGWNVGSYNNGVQIFEVLNPGVVDLKFGSFSGNSGEFLIQYYENSTTVTKQKTVTWN